MTTAKTKRLLTFILALVFCATLFSVTSVAGAKKVSVSSSLFTKIDNVTIASTEKGLTLTSSNKANSSATFANTLYVGNLSFVFSITEANFYSFALKFTSEVNDVSHVGLINITENKLIFTQKENKLYVALNGGTAENTGLDVTAKVKVAFDGNKFTVSSPDAAGNTEFAVTSIFAYNEATLELAFNNIERDKKAQIIIEEINGQKFLADTSLYIDDNQAPILRLNKLKTFNDTDKQIVYAPLNQQYTLPAYAIDVISTSFTYEMKVDFGGDSIDANTITDWKAVAKEDLKSLKVSLKNQGWYRITEVKVKDGNDNYSTNFVASDVVVSEDKPIYVYAKAWVNNQPVIDYSSFAEYQTLVVCTETSKYQFAMPTVTQSSVPTEAANNPYVFEYVVRYKEPNSTSTTWSESKGLIFEAKKTGGEYLFWIQVIDKLGNKSEMPDQSKLMKISFVDEIVPKLAITNFPTEKYVDQTVTLPTPTTTDALDSAPTKVITVYYIKNEAGDLVYETDEDGNIVYEKDEDGEFVLENGEKVPVKIIASKSYSFVPEKKGTYEVIYSATDKAGNESTMDAMYFSVIDAPPAPINNPFIDTTNPWTIVLLCVAGASALGIVALMFVKPKED